MKYEPLVSERPEFRLLTLKPVEFSKRDYSPDGTTIKVYCELKHSFRDPPPTYTTLSYTWGPDSPAEYISVNNEIVKVGRNLEEALIHLRLKQDDLIIWVDALCIDQKNKEERSRQVQHMQNFYSESSDTIVWLGPAENESDACIALLDDIGNKMKTSLAFEAVSQMVMASSAELYESSRKRATELLTPLCNAQMQNGLILMRGFRALLDRPYWKRLWIQQEVAVARSIEFRCGHSKLSFSHMHACIIFMRYFRMHLLGMSAALYLKGEYVEKNRWFDYTFWFAATYFTQLFRPVTIYFMQLFRMHIFSVGTVQEWENDIIPLVASHPSKIFGLRARFQKEDAQEDLMEVLVRVNVIGGGSQRVDCGDSMDRVFGLLGIAKDTKKLGIKVDYTKSIGVIYTETARALIEAGHVDLLSYCQFPKDEKLSLPSWAPDWSQEVLRPCGDYHFETFFKASGHQYEKIPRDPSRASDNISLRGARIDIIEDIGSAWEPPTDGTPPLGLVGPFLAEIQSLCSRSDQKNKPIYHNSTDRDDAYYRIPIADQEMTDDGFHRRASASCEETYRKLLQDTRGKPDKNDSWSKKGSYLNMMGYLHFRRPFLSGNGYVGLGPEILVAGDIICTFLGAKLPYIVRANGDGTFRLVGEAYVHGVMYGEFWELEQKPEREVFVVI